MKKSSEKHRTHCALPIFVSCAAGPRRPLRYAPRPAGPCATETKIGDQSPKEIELKALPL
jgi:hypothetical protein